MRKAWALHVIAFWLVSTFVTTPSLLWAASECPPCSSFGVQRPTVKKEAPPFSLRSLGSASPISLSSVRGKPVLLFFWGSWCDSCKEDIVLLEKFAEGKQDQISILTIVVDGEREKRIRQIVDKYKIKFPVLLLLKENVIDTYEIRMVPMVAVIDPEGFMVGKIIGQRDWTKPEAWASIKHLCGLQ